VNFPTQKFEWAWQKPQLSRHLRTHPPPNFDSTKTFIPKPIFPSTSTSRTRKGRTRTHTKGSPQARILVARALLLSEPFCHWGLKVVCFSEWSWGAWMNLELESSSNQLGASDEVERTMTRISRSGKLLPPSNLSPYVVCDFQGVDGNRKPFLEMSDKGKKEIGLLEERKLVGLPTSSKGKSKAKEDVVGNWNESLPLQSSAKGMGTSWKELREAPTYPRIAIESGNESGSGNGRKRLGTEENIESLEETQWRGKLPRVPLDDGEFLE